MKKVALLMLVLAGCNKPAGVPAAGPPGPRRLPKVTITRAEARPLSSRIDVIGIVEPRQQVAVAAGVAGIVETLDFQEGKTVTPATVLCSIDKKRFEFEVARASAERTRAATDHKRSSDILAQRLPLHAKKHITDEELSDLQAAVDRADAEQKRAQAALDLAQKALHDSEVRPPIAGIINSRNVSIGEYVEARTVIATIVDISELHVRFAVPQNESISLKRDDAVSFTIRGADPAPIAGKIFWVSQTADARARTVECKAILSQPPATLKPGFSGNVRLTLSQREKAVVVPLEAVLPTERGFVAYVLEGTVARERKLTVGLHTQDDHVEIVAGVREGEIVVVRGGGAVKDGGDVEVVK